VAGVPVTGAATLTGEPSFRWTGKVGSIRFSVDIGFSLGAGAAAADVVHITGIYGTSRIVGAAAMVPANPSLLHFTGTVGTHHVSVTVHQPVRRGNTTVVRASFTGA
jgi:hypothetical protein